MQIDIFPLLGVRRAQVEADVAYIEILRDYWVAEAVLARILAGGSAELAPDAAVPLRRRGSGTTGPQREEAEP